MSNKFNPDFAHFDPLSVVRQALAPVARAYGRKRVISGNFEAAITDLEAADMLMLCPIRSHAVLHSFKISNDTLDSVASITVDVGVTDKDGADINPGAGDSRDMFDPDSTAFQTATLPAAAVEMANHLAAQNSPNAMGTQLWERANLQTAAAFAADPNALWFLSMRIVIVAATPVAATIGLQVEYTLD